MKKQIVIILIILILGAAVYIWRVILKSTSTRPDITPAHERAILFESITNFDSDDYLDDAINDLETIEGL